MFSLESFKVTGDVSWKSTKRSMFLLEGFMGFLYKKLNQIMFLKQNVFNLQLSEDECQFYNESLCALP